MGAVINTFSSLTGKRRLRGSGFSLGPVSYLLGGGEIYFQILWSRKKNLQGSYSSGPLCRGMRLSRTLPPPVRRTHQSYKLWSDLVFPFEGVYHFFLFYLLIYFSFNRIWFILLSEPENKGVASNHPRRAALSLCPRPAPPS